MIGLSEPLLADIHGRIREASHAQDEQRVQDGIDDLDRVRGSLVGRSVHPELNRLSKALGETLPSGPLYGQGVHLLRRWCRKWKRVPSSYALTDAVELDSPGSPFSSSALSDVYIGRSRGVKVAVKRLRLHVDSHQAVHNVRPIHSQVVALVLSGPCSPSGTKS
jgi:hypothetical protein